ncbi:MAG: DHH family phosphoesterase [Candidatus Kerfeldbacteria bacterium]|nr:DHH family phosphoesterase [Candidatus Kerfeldbacteria bacterium]
MSLPIPEQIREAITRSDRILITTSEHPTTDAIASCLAFYALLEQLGKKAKVVCHNFSLPPSHAFLPKSTEIERELTALRKFIITLDTRRTKVAELSYDTTDDALQVYITPKNGFFEERDVRTSAGRFAYDLIIILDTPELAALGKIAEANAEFFYHTPIVNIDHSPANERFGQINLIDVTATSTSEILFELLQQIEPKFLNEYIATHLLTGIISKTKSFQTPSVTPKSLTIASHLITSGARREEIVQHLYRTKSVTILKLWGRVLSRLQFDRTQQIVWATISRDLIADTTNVPDQLRGIIDELIVNIPDARSIFLLWEAAPNEVWSIVSTDTATDALALFREYHPSGTQDFTELHFPGVNLTQAEQRVLEKLRSVGR